MKRPLTVAFALILVVPMMDESLQAQPPGGGGPGGGFGGPGRGPGGPGGGGGPGGPNGPDLAIVQEYDRDGDGRLNASERVAAREAVISNRESGGRRGPGGGRGGPGGGRGGPGGGRGGPRFTNPGTPGESVSPSDVTGYHDQGLYDRTVLRTLFLEFENEDWEKELADFKPTDVEIAANLIVDGKPYRDVGVSFRGSSSFFMVPEGLKRSLNLSIDFVHQDQRLYGYRSLNLLNCNGDASMMSSALYSTIASQRIATPKVNFVKVVINGESWGLYCSSQQFDKDFLKENFGTTGGARWKVSGSPRGDGGLRYLGEEFEPYRQRFEIKSKDKESSWRDLIQLCKVLNETPADQLEQALDPLLDIDGVLWFLAVDVALINSDGYWVRASDYNLYQDPTGKFHVLPHDMNEAFRGARGGGGPGGPGGRGGGPPGFGPPGFGPPGFGPPPDRGGGDRPREGDRRIGDGAEGRGAGGPGRGGFDRGGPPERGGRGRGGPPGGSGRGGPERNVELDPLVGIEDAAKPLRSKLLANEKLRTRYLQHVRTIAEQWLNWDRIGPHVADSRKLLEEEVAKDTRKLFKTEDFLAATSPAAVGEDNSLTGVRAFAQRRANYLLGHEAISELPKKLVSLSQSPSASPAKDRQSSPNASSVESAVVISEVMAIGSDSIQDPQGEAEDWIELHNQGTKPVDLSGYYLSDKRDAPHKWMFPAGVTIAPGGYLVVWADNDVDAKPGLHAGFKLSKKGERVTLSSRQGVLGEIEFGQQAEGQSFGRFGQENQSLTPTPGAANRVKP
jgi:hypothetical protein